VPALFPPQPIGDNMYYDGGTTFGSPVSVLHTDLKRRVAHTPVHVTYFSAENMMTHAFPHLNGVVCSPTSNTQLKYETMFTCGVNAHSSMYTSLLLMDRMNAILMVGSPRDFDYSEHVMTLPEFQAFQKTRLTHTRSVVELYPVHPHRISMSAFTPHDIRKAMASVTQLGVRAWIVPTPA
jgi:predicted acylesterase/phospholipase RssA